MIVYSRKARLCGTKPSRLERNMNSNKKKNMEMKRSRQNTGEEKQQTNRIKYIKTVK